MELDEEPMHLQCEVWRWHRGQVLREGASCGRLLQMKDSRLQQTDSWQLSINPTPPPGGFGLLCCWLLLFVISSGIYRRIISDL